MSVSIRTVESFESAHRTLSDSGKCVRLHGHNWKVEIEITGNPNDDGYIVDFKELKNVIKLMDHKVLLKEDDPLLELLWKNPEQVYTLKNEPTCENLSKHIAEDLIPKNKNIEVILVRVWENDNSYGETIINVEKSNNNNELLEKLATIEHVQWEWWSRNIASLLETCIREIEDGNPGVATSIMEEKIKNWKNYYVSYDELPEDIKELDRYWARQVLNILEVDSDE